MKKKIIAIVSCVLLLAVTGTGAGIYFWKNKPEEKLAENQRYVYASIQSIQGNEVTYMEIEEEIVTAYLEAQETDAEEDAEKVKEKAEEGATGGGMLNFSEGGEMPDMSNMPSFSEGGKMPDMGSMPNFSEGGEMPDMGSMPNFSEGGEMPDRGGMPNFSEGGEMPDMGNMPSFSGRGENNQERQEMAGMSQSAGVTTLIPVGIKVHTTTDTVTTFGRLVSGDMIKMLMETDAAGEEVITEIWMM